MSELILDHKENIIPPQYFGFMGLTFLTIRYTGALFVLFILLSFCRKRALSGKNFSHHRPAEALFRTVHVNPAGQTEPPLCNPQSQPLGETNSSPHVVGPVGHCRAPWGLTGETWAHLWFGSPSLPQLPLLSVNCSSRRPEKTASSWIQRCSPTDEKET